MLNTPMNINVIKYRNEGKHFFYDLDSGVFAESTELLDDIFNLISTCNKEEIIARLKGKYPETEIIQHLSVLGTMHDNKQLFYKRPKLSQQKKEKKILANLWLNTSHDCNLRCIYCYGHGGSYGTDRELMTVETAKKCIDYWYDNIGDHKKHIIHFFGGEPFMNKETIEFSIDYLNELFKDSGKNLAYRATTNGTIYDEDFFEKLGQNKTSLMISVDGGPGIQDKNRPFKNHKGSYQAIAGNVKKIKKHISQLRASIVLTREDAPYLKDSVMNLWDIGFNDINSAFVIIDDDDLSFTEKDLEILIPQIKELNDITYDNIINRRPYVFAKIFDICFVIHNKIDNECSFQSDGSILFTPDGGIFKCHRFIEFPEYKIGNIKDAGQWQQITPQFTKPREQLACNDCQVYPFCGGGCAHENLVYNNDINIPYDINCKFREFLVDEAFRLYTRLYINAPDALDACFGIH
jgi:uncharacterized protein